MLHSLVRHKIFRFLWLSALSICTYCILYLIAAIVLSNIPTSEETTEDRSIPIFLRSNGVHTDLVLPAKNELCDWTKDILFEHTRSHDTAMKYIGIGWGNKGFYLETPTWSDLEFRVAFNAVFGLGGSAMHTTYYPDMQEGPDVIVLHLSRDQYLRLLRYIRQSFALDAQGKVRYIPTTAVYSDFDAFYEAVGHYTMFHTCNTWTNDALKACGQRAVLWTPFQGALMAKR